MQKAISALKASGVEKTVMLTGDAKNVADQVAATLGIHEVYSELLPAGKVSKVEELLSKNLQRQGWHLWEMALMMHLFSQERTLA